MCSLFHIIHHPPGWMRLLQKYALAADVLFYQKAQPKMAPPMGSNPSLVRAGVNASRKV
jgi:hypothetical protein